MERDFRPFPKCRRSRTEAAAGGRVVGPEGPLIAGVAMVGIGLIHLANTFIPWFDRLVWPLAVVIAGAGLIYLGVRRDN